MRFDIIKNADGTYSIFEHDYDADFLGGILSFAAVMIVGIFTHPAWAAGILAHLAVSAVLKFILHFTADREQRIKVRVYGNVARFLLSEAAMHVFGSIDIGFVIVLTLISSGCAIHAVKQEFVRKGVAYETDRLWLTAKYVSILTMIAAVCSMYV